MTWWHDYFFFPRYALCDNMSFSSAFLASVLETGARRMEMQKRLRD